MNRTPIAPMGVGKLLDKSFSVYRQHFGAFFLLALIWFGPLLLLQQLLLVDLTRVPLLAQDTEGMDFAESLGARFAGQEEFMTQSLPMLLIFIFLVAPILLIIAYPQMISGSILLTKAALEGETLSLKDALKGALRRFWPLAGSTFLYGVIAFAVSTAFVIVYGLIFVMIAFAGGMTLETMFDPSDEGSIVLMIVLVLFGYLFLIAGMMLVPGYFLIRWGFYMPLVLFERDGVGIGQSWNMTKGNFWRLFGLFVVLSVIYSMFSSGMQLVLTGVLGTSILAQIILVALTCLLTPWMAIVYALAYFDLRVRKEGTDLQELVSRQLATSAPVEPATPTPAQEPGVTHD
ncbi:ABC transporter ATP-binding protein [Brevibacillus sp. HB1.2]|uniref:glycerophosphoryl diester phosphodiesterase membrane domain-containing protein n=1 Tax=Brevibacillus TaxID=55080 RepID=UPI00156B239A|nr:MULTISPECIES: glycerophosphoryl diester phosphodiesterase membrane domain-containing protein [unclassified Brevibacillus]NRS15954.1 glycerophosphoryl diester phosphodiesterase membrane domain-containing protein [Brevibacillus sp. HB1.4B]NTU19874.1 ABC transporter ATP-binding protein [Brevibacillus sp. HB1.2]NTU29115.1 ABC transporter ATP-binding protein [Brevibacillus sp. HB1.1]